MPNTDFMELPYGSMERAYPYCGNIGCHNSKKVVKTIINGIVKQIKDYHKEMIGKHLDLYESDDGSWGEMRYLETIEIR